MLNSSKPSSATLPHIAGTNFPPLELDISSKFQFCVNAGAAAAAGFFDNLSDLSLHNHIAYSLKSFMASIGAGLAATGKHEPFTMQSCTDSFAAGYLGRIQQELRLFHGDGSGGTERGATGRTAALNINPVHRASHSEAGGGLSSSNWSSQ